MNDINYLTLDKKYINPIENHLSKKLISNKNFSRIQSIAKILPHDLTSYVVLEFRPGEVSTNVDFAFAVSDRKGEERNTLANLKSFNNLPVKFWESPEWNQILNLAESWENKNSILNKKIHSIWFEFDISHKTIEVPIPSIGIGITDNLSNDVKNKEEYEWLTKDAFTLLMGKKLPDSVIKNIHSCITKLPAGSSVFFAASMLSRPKAQIRLCMKKIKPDQIIPYLESLNWDDKSNVLSNFIDELKNHANRFVLDFDVLEKGIGTRIGIECSFSPDKYQYETRWESFFDFLSKKQLIISEKQKALLNFQGEVDLNNNIARYIGHTKIVYEPDGKIEAKTYLTIKQINKV